MQRIIAREDFVPCIGCVGENLATCVVVPFSPEFSDSTIQLFYTLPNSSEPHEADRIKTVDNSVYWFITSAVTAKAGRVMYQLHFTCGNAVSKSPVYEAVVLRSINE